MNISTQTAQWTRRAFANGLSVSRTPSGVLIQNRIIKHRFISGKGGPADKFQGKRTTWDVKIPSEDDASSASQQTAEVPFEPDFYNSKAKTAETEAKAAPKALPDEVPLPKVVTVSGENTHVGGGPSSNVYQTSADISAFKEAGNVDSSAGILSEFASSLSKFRLPGLGASSDLSAAANDENPIRELSEEEVKGLYILLGIVGGGWLLGGLFSKGGSKPKKHT